MANAWHIASFKNKAITCGTLLMAPYDRALSKLKNKKKRKDVVNEYKTHRRPAARTLHDTFIVFLNLT